MQRGQLSRRGFLEGTVGTLAAAGLPLWFAKEVVAEEAKKAAEKAKPVAANDQIVMGAIGIGSPQSRGRHIYGEARKIEGVRYVAACDVDANHLKRAIEKDMAPRDKDVKGYADFRELLDDKNINAVTIATPDQWHALVAIEAMKRGKDVYCEKPLTLTIAEGQAIVKVAKATGRVFQTGSQQRSEMGGMFRLATELVRNGRVGKVKRIECRIGGNPKGTFKTEEPPPGLNWDMWLGPCPKVPYVKQRCHYEYRWWYDYSGGKMTDWGAHHLDIAQWMLDADKSGPVAVEGSGEEPSKEPNSYNTHPTFQVNYRYENGVEVVAISHNDKKDARFADKKFDNGVIVEGEDGKWLFVSRGMLTASDEKLVKEPLGKDATRLHAPPKGNHMLEFIECVRERKRQPNCNAEVGHHSATVCHIGVIATRTGKKLKWDPVAQKFDDAEANAHLSREMRAPWKLDA